MMKRPATSLVSSALSVLSVLFSPAQAADLTVAHAATLPATPDDKAWQKAPEFVAPLLPQDMVEPRLLEASTAEVKVRAVSDGKQIAFRLEWADATKDDLADTGRFADACAVQMPARTEADVPAPQMGETAKPVEIVYWRASWQAMVDGRPDDIRAVHPNATVDHYPFDAAPLGKDSPERQEMAKRYAPARALDNPMAGPRAQPVQDLLAEGPGTIRPAARQVSTGAGRRTDRGWSVVLTRPLPAGFNGGTRSQVAFAVWDGAHQEVGARKMRSVWLPIGMEEKK